MATEDTILFTLRAPGTERGLSSKDRPTKEIPNVIVLAEVNPIYDATNTILNAMDPAAKLQLDSTPKFR